MIVTVIRCDRCEKLVDSPPPKKGEFTAGYYANWVNFTNPGEKHVCDACMWADPRYIGTFGDLRPFASPKQSAPEEGG